MKAFSEDTPISRPLKVLSVTLGDALQNNGENYVHRLRGEGVECDLLVLPYRKRWRRIIEALWAARIVRNYDVVITNEYNNAFAFSLIGNIYTKKIKNIVIGMNLSSRALKCGVGIVDSIVDRVFQSLTAIVVHSREEIELFARLHRISREKIRFSSWGFDVPSVADSTDDFHPGSTPYFCMIGRNNRDFATFLAALKTIDASGVIVCDSGERLSIPEGARVRVFHNLSMEECASCIRYSMANVVLVKDADRGAGHITAVMGMLFAKPHVFSDVPTLQDYLVNSQHGIGVKIGDVAAVANAMKVLKDNSALAQQFGKIGQSDALQMHSHKASQERIWAILVEELGL